MKTGKKHFFIISSFIVILLTGTYACDRAAPPEIATEPGIEQTEPDIQYLLESLNIQSITETVVSPDFTLTSIDGEEVSLSHYRGKVVMLGFWTTW